MYSDAMNRTQIYLTPDEEKLLDRAAEATGASKSELIRRAIRASFGELTTREKIAALRRSAGAWKDRDFDGAQYVDSIRGDLNARLRQLGFD
ncbi:MAG TPA: CopG family transcriptional regulator [Dehalococcoidia bacterium]|nr:CopG family transcriptional regulator [Dehalococcoidia bacterium]